MNLGKILSVRKVLRSHADEKIPSMVAYKIMKFLKSTDSEEEFYNKKLNEIIEEYALRGDDGKIKTNDKDGGIQIIPSKLEDCKKAIEELQSTDVDMPNIKMSMEELSVFQMSVVELTALDDFIENKEN